jgi:hypothetical protein
MGETITDRSLRCLPNEIRSAEVQFPRTKPDDAFRESESQPKWLQRNCSGLTMTSYDERGTRIIRNVSLLRVRSRTQRSSLPLLVDASRRTHARALQNA